MLTAGDPAATAMRLAAAIDADLTPDVLLAALPVDSTVCVVGWPDLVAEAVLRRGDIGVLAIDADGQASSFVDRLERAGVEAEVVDPSGAAAAVLAADIVLIEALAASPAELLAVRGSRAAACVAYCAEVPVWAVVGVGRCLPDEAFASLVAGVADVRAPWEAIAEVVPLALCSSIADQAAVTAAGSATLVPECPVAHELLRSSFG
jgi:hypothetical protein